MAAGRLFLKAPSRSNIILSVYSCTASLFSMRPTMFGVTFGEYRRRVSKVFGRKEVMLTEIESILDLHILRSFVLNITFALVYILGIHPSRRQAL